MYYSRRGFTLVELLVVIAVLGVLMGLIMPALMSARSQARLTSCASNLNQIGQAVHMYLNRFSDYLPGYPGYGKNVGTISDGTYAATNAGFQTLASRYMVIGLNTNRAPADLVEGRLNFMPVGLGNLVITDVMPDIRGLMCPAMRGTVRTLYAADNDFDFHADLDRRIGGLEPQRLYYGDGTRLRSHNNNAVALLSSYSYRMQAHYWDGAAPNSSRTLSYTNPTHTAYYMTPVFKTIRSLNERALASDSFDKAPGMSRGLGEYGHGNAYNVLYADGRVKVYNDPQQTILTWDVGASHTNNLTISSPMGDQIFHIFDRAEGYDEP